MAYSDDEGEAPLPGVVSDYSFFDHNDELISFSELSLIWDGDQRLEGSKKEISLGGTTDNGLQKIYEQVVAWKFDFSSAKPEIFVLSKKKNWIKLLKPRKSFEKTVRTILITVHFLNFLKRNPETSEKALWDHLAKVFSLYEPRSSENDLFDHTNLIGEAVKRDETLARSKALATFLREKPLKNKVPNEVVGTETMSDFIVDDVTEENGEDGFGEEEQDFFESVCAICDNGGDLLCCEGKCMRSFHATEEAGSDSACKSLGFSEEQVAALGTFECKNCQYKQHQCFICGELGASDKSAGAEVFQCVTGTCGYFYHPHCVAGVLHSNYGDETKDLEGKIAAGEPFMCPLHKCYACKGLEPEDPDDLQMQFAVCRRCPRAYHRKCLPTKIAFEDDTVVNIVQRAWEGLMPNKILIYCLKHEIEDELETPVRDHIKFPDTDQKKNKQTGESVGRDKSVPKKRVDATGKKVVPKRSQGTDKLFAGKSPVDSSTRNERLSTPKSLKKLKFKNHSRAALKKTSAGTQDKTSGVESKNSLGNQLYALYSKDSEPKGEMSDLNRQRITGEPGAKEVDNSLIIDADSKRRILSIIKEAESSITLEDVTLKHQVPSTHAFSSKNAVQSITLGRLEATIKALRVALQKLEAGGSLEDAKAVCPPGLLNQIAKWKARLRVFLAPFLYGPRYTSFGRHFTKVEKLKSIIDKLHCYVQDGDTIVDFCCGSNDFSCLVREKLDQMGKNCRYKNYDIFPAKNDFNFEKRDWMTVCLRELPPGPELIMGLNPPFGVNASLANQFIEKALGFKPKLLILIAPRETLRLDERKNNPYDLVWEDKELLCDKSFYLPGSVDANGKQMEDWNVNAPPLSLWSRPDWTQKHKGIALENGHLSTAQEVLYERDAPDCKPEASVLCQTPPVAGGLQDVQQPHEGAKATENGTESCPRGSGAKESHMAHDSGKDEANDTFEEVNKDNRKRRRGRDEKSTERRSLPRHSSPSISGSRSLGNHLSRHPEMHSRADIQREGYQHFDHIYSSGSPRHLQRGQDVQQPHEGAKATENGTESCPYGSGAKESHMAHDRGKDEANDAFEEVNKSNRKRRRGRDEKSTERRSLPRHSSPSVSGGRPLGNHLSRHPEMHSRADIQREGYQHFDHVYGSGSQRHLQRGHGGYPGDGTGRRNSYGEEPFSDMQERRALHSIHGSDYGSVVSDEQFPAYRGDFRRVTGYGREAEMRAQVQMYGHHDPVPYGHRDDTYFTSAPSGFSFSYSQRGPAVSPAYDSMNSSAMQRYAPRLDELNHTRMHNMGSMQPFAGISGMYSPAPPPEYRPDSLGFAAGPYRPYSQQSTSGWLNE